MNKTVAIVGTLDTKGEEIDYLRSLIEKRGHRVITADTGILGEPLIQPDISRYKLAIAGGADIDLLRKRRDEAFFRTSGCCCLYAINWNSVLKGRNCMPVLK